MKVRIVHRYYCDYCKKSMSRKPAMEKHEKHCTMNPQRECRVCDIKGNVTTPLGQALSILPNPADYERKIPAAFGETYRETDTDGLRAAVTAALPKLHDCTDGCPMCMFAALRQKKLLVWVDEKEFDFKRELATFWNEYNAANERRGYVMEP